tara:strand:- start:333 stop:1211 length:879 start_codon:yes stop_codon:yes gene_type:complete
VFLHGIEKAKKEQLVDLLTFLQGPGLVSVLADKSNRLLKIIPYFKKLNTSNYVEQKVIKLKTELSNEDTNELRNKIIYWFCKASGHKYKNRNDTSELSQKCLLKCVLCFGLSKNICDFERLEKVLVGRYLRRIGDQLEDLLLQTNPEQLDKFGIKLEEEFRKYGEIDKNHLINELKLDNLSNKTFINIFRDALVAGTGISLIKTLGFSTFIKMSSSIFAIGSTFGITLPFVYYTSASSLLSFLLGPVGFGLILIGLGSRRLVNLYSEINRERLLIAIVVLHAILIDSQSKKK